MSTEGDPAKEDLATFLDQWVPEQSEEFEGGPSTVSRGGLQAAYTEACNTFRQLTTVRFSLLTLLPAATGGAIVASDKAGLTGGISAFAAVITLALWIYDLRNNQHYDALVGQAAHLERLMGVHAGPFNNRPTSWWKLLHWPELGVEHRWPIALVYGACLTAWLSKLCTHASTVALPKTDVRHVGVWLLCGGLVWLLAAAAYERSERRREVLRREVRNAAAFLALSKSWVEDVKTHAGGLPGLLTTGKGQSRLAYYSHHPIPSLPATTSPPASPSGTSSPPATASRSGTLSPPGTTQSPNATVRAIYTLAQVTDLPVHWINDVVSRRRVGNYERTRAGWWAICMVTLGLISLFLPRACVGRLAASANAAAGSIVTSGAASVNQRAGAGGASTAKSAGAGGATGTNPSAGAGGSGT